MKHIKLITLLFGLLLFGCNQKENKKTVPAHENSAKKKNEKTQKKDNLAADNQKLHKDEIARIKTVIDLFQHQNIEEISNIISFPLERQYPIPKIKDKAAFMQRFREVFDENLIGKIANSNIEQWSVVGWRGIMFDNGVLWITNSDGLITAINYQTAIEKNLRNDLIAQEKEKLHLSIKTFEKPTYKIKTKNYLIRIDVLTTNKYRYASWKTGKKESSKPDIIVDNGVLEFDGSGGNHVITFVNGKYTYKVYRNIIGEENSSDFTVEIEQQGKAILKEEGTLVIE